MESDAAGGTSNCAKVREDDGKSNKEVSATDEEERKPTRDKPKVKSEISK